MALGKPADEVGQTTTQSLVASRRYSYAAGRQQEWNAVEAERKEYGGDELDCLN